MVDGNLPLRNIKTIRNAVSVKWYDGFGVTIQAPELSLWFKYSGGRPPVINSAWVHALMAEANTAAGLHLVPEPAAT
jgi:hypothetical protein